MAQHLKGDRASSLIPTFVRTEVSKDKPFKDANGFRVRYKGIKGIAAAGQTTDIDYELTEERYLNGVHLILENHSSEDSVTFQVIDKNNITGLGVNYILDQFGDSWNICTDQQSQNCAQPSYYAKIIPGLFIRIKYISTGQSNVKVRANLFLHIKVI